MRLKLKLRFNYSTVLRMKPAYRMIAAGTALFALLTAVVITYLNVGNVKNAYATGPSETMLTGSFIINMGVTPQTNNNGLRPYGMIYDLIKNYKVPVKWSIEPTKAKDGTDFTYSGVNYKGGPFVVPAEYITAAVATRITYWQGQGVNGVYTTAPLTIPVYATVTNFPVIMIDTLSGLQSIITNYYTLASIPSSAYTLGAPAGLNQCYDIWTNPHGDPTWASHGYLYNFVVNQKGWVWSQCHCVSMLEGVSNPNPPYEKLNFLTLNSLKCWQSGGCGSIPEFHALSAVSPFTYYNPTNPEMQFMSGLELATQAGSERWFQPLSTGGWNASTKIGVSTATGSAPQQGVLVAYGYAYGNTNNGRVMYVAGHDLTSGGGGAAQPHKVSAIRTYYNFMLLAGKDRELYLTASMPPDTLVAGSSSAVSVTVTNGTPSYTYLWTSDRGGSFSDPTAASTTYYPPSSPVDTFDVIKVIVTDQCNRVNIQTKRIAIKANVPLPVSLVSFCAAPVPEGIKISWSTASESGNDFFTLEHSADGIQYFALDNIDGSGNSSEILNYSYVDEHPLPGTNYYRLTQTDFDGTEKIFNSISIKKDDEPFSLSVVNVYPNPFTGDFSITYNSGKITTTQIEIRNAGGRLVYNQPLDSKEGINRYDFSKKVNLPNGIYFVSLAQEKNKTEAKRIVKY